MLMLLVSGCAPAVQPPEPSTEALTAEIFYAVDSPEGLRLASETREVEATKDTLASVVLSQLISGDLLPLDPDYINLWGQPNQLNQIDTATSDAVVDLRPVTLNVGAEGEVMAINQLVWTLTGIEPVLQTVSFAIDGSPAESFAGHVDTLSDFKRGIDYEVLSSIQIESLNEGATLSNPITVAGQACTFEANLRWTLTQNGAVVREGSTLAAEACPVRSPWSVELGKLSPGEYEFLAQAFSPKDGSLLVEDDKRFKVE